MSKQISASSKIIHLAII